jgi:hypothetical protein
MLAYNKNALYNLFVRSQTSDAYESGATTKEEYAAVLAKYPSQFYTPNFFMCIGLFILTVVILIFSIGIISLAILRIGLDNAITALAILFSSFCFIFLEVLIRRRKHYHSGVDTALQWSAAIILFSGIAYGTEAHGLLLSIIIFIISLACTIRYANTLMATVTFLSFLSIFFFTFSDVGILAKAILPFVFIVISFVIYFAAKKINNRRYFTGYEECTLAVEVTSLITLYAAGNYFVVKQIGDLMFNTNFSAQPMPFRLLFWILTVAIPLVYLFFGIKNKDAILLRVGLV